MLSRGLLITVGALLSAAIAGAAQTAGALTRGGAVAALIVGTLVFGFGGLGAGLLLVTFFVSSSLLTRWRAERKRHPEHRRGRSASQVIANGAAATAAAIWWGIAPSALAAAALAGAIATATADTWATEIGTLSPEQARLITTRRPVPPGTSGGVTWRGTLAGILGATIIAAGAYAFFDVSPAVVWLAGILGMTVDSILGAAAEGTVTWMNNDAVNLLATASGAVLAMILVVFS